MDSKKSNKIRDIVRLHQILKKWKHLATSSSKPSSSSSSSSVGKSSISFLKRTLSGDRDPAAGNVVPKGFLAVSVGPELKRFVIPTQYLSHPAVRELLREAEEEFGFQQAGVLRLPCEVGLFESVLKVVERKKTGRFARDNVSGYCASESGPLTPAHHPQSPLCR